MLASRSAGGMGGFLPVCFEVRKRSKRSPRWLRGQAQRFLSAHTFIYGQGRRQIVHQLPAAHEPLLLGLRQTQKHFRSSPHALQIVLALVDIRRGRTALEQAINRFPGRAR